MKGRPQRLGSGLGALLPTDTGVSVREVAIEAIRQNPRQPRTIFDESALEELASSIREHGVIQPLIVSERPEGGYELIAGERRWRASQRAGRSSVPVIVRETTPQQLLELAIIENVQRADLNPMEEAHAYQALKDEFQLSDDEIARRVGKNHRVTIANTRRLLRLPPDAQSALLSNTITAGHGRALLKLDEPAQQLAALEVITTHELSVREAERLGDLTVRYEGDLARALAEIRPQLQKSKSVHQESPATLTETPKVAKEPSADDRAVAHQLEELLGTPVQLSRSERDVRLTITFYDEEKLQEFFDRLSQ